jgi:hypothetical protein
MPIILATQEAKIRRLMVQRQPGQRVPSDRSSKTPSQKIRLAKCLKVQSLSSSPSTAKKEKKY